MWKLLDTLIMFLRIYVQKLLIMKKIALLEFKIYIITVNFDWDNIWCSMHVGSYGCFIISSIESDNRFKMEGNWCE